MKYVENRDGYYGVVTTDKDGKEVNYSHIGKEILLIMVLMSIETGEVTWLLSFDYLSRTITTEFERGEIANKTALSQLISKGADIQPKYSDIAIQSIMNQEFNRDVLETFYNVGWITMKSEDTTHLAFRSDSLIGGDGQYNGKYKLDTMGTFKGWKTMVKNDIIGRPALEIVLLASMSAVVNGLIAPVTTGENPIFHLCAPSGTGKSTIGYVACSVFGEPYEGAKPIADSNGITKSKKSVFGSWSSTENALISDACGNQGMCIILNELGKYQGKDLTSIVYGFSDGVEKNRLDAKYNGSIKDNFCTSIISIGESSLIEKCKTKEIGIKTRVFEIDSQLTDDADHSSRLKSASRENNGWAANALAKHIISHGGIDYVKAIYDDIKSQLIEGVNDGQYIRFVEKFTALLVTTAILVNESMNLGFNEQSIVKFCDDYWLQKEDENGSVDKSYEEIIEIFKVNDVNFLHNNNTVIPNVFWGKIEYPNETIGDKKLVIEYSVRTGILKDLLISKGYTNPQTYLKKWRDKGVLVGEAGKLVNRRNLVPKGDRESVYIIQVWEDKEGTNGISNR